MRCDFDAIAILLLVDFHLVGLQRGQNHYLVGAAGPDGDCTELGIDGDSGVGSHREAVFLMRFGERCRYQAGCQ